MILFPVIENEPIVQENDKTRLDASKSFGSGSGSITEVQVKPSRTGAFVDVTTDRFLDWAYPFELEVDAANDKVHFNQGAGVLTATLAHGSYSMAALAVEIQAKMRAVGGALAYVVSLSSKNAFTIAAPAVFSLDPTQAASVLPSIGYSAALSAALTYTGEAVEEIAKLVTVQLTDESLQTKTTTSTVQVISELADDLYATDQDLRTHESDILKYVADGRATFKDFHRRAQQLILDYINKNGWLDIFAQKITKEHVVEKDQLRDWSAFMSLRLIFEGSISQVNDVFTKKAKHYEDLECDARKRLVLKLDLNKDGVASPREQITPFTSAFVVRR
jgi:hypothetical protein